MLPADISPFAAAVINIATGAVGKKSCAQLVRLQPSDELLADAILPVMFEDVPGTVLQQSLIIRETFAPFCLIDL